MDLTNSALWTILAIFSITAVFTKIANGRITYDPVCTLPPRPQVRGISLLRLLPTLCTKGPEATMQYLYKKFGSIFTVSFVWKRITFLVGGEASVIFFQGSESEVTQGDTYEFTVPMFGQEIGFAVDYNTRMEQIRFIVESVRPTQLRSYVDPMLEEVEVSTPSISTSILCSF
jgi:sterol 14-demethylase